jgi:hypothetical protein
LAAAAGWVAMAAVRHNAPRTAERRMKNSGGKIRRVVGR